MKLKYAVEGRLFATNIEIKLVFLTTDITNYLRKMYVEIGANDCIRIVCQAQPPVVLILMSALIFVPPARGRTRSVYIRRPKQVLTALQSPYTRSKEKDGDTYKRLIFCYIRACFFAFVSGS